MISSLKTAGEYATEQDSETALDRLLAGVDHFFKVAREVDGDVWSPRKGHKSVRIDRVLWPKPALIELGWSYGVSGLELKKSGHNAGKVVNQACDYVDAVWRIKTSGVKFVLNQVFLFPELDEHFGTVSSVLAANRIGFASELCRDKLHLCLNNSSMLHFTHFGDNPGWVVGKSSNLHCGWKTGSR